MCGAINGDIDPCDGTTLSFTVEFISEIECQGDPVKNMRVICSCCFEGLRGLNLPKPDRVHLMSQIRRATHNDQEAVMNWILTKFGMVAVKKAHKDQ